jgi:hypothetical protein
MGRPVISDVRSNRQASTGRVYLIVLDDLDVSPLRSTQVRKSARELVEKYYGADDVGAVVCTSGVSKCAQEFTSDPALLVAAIDKFVGRRLRSAELDRLDAFYQTQALPPSDQDELQKQQNPDQPDPDPNSQEGIKKVLDRMVISDPFALSSYDPNNLERGMRAVGVMDSMRHLAEFLSTVRGCRKALLLSARASTIRCRPYSILRAATKSSEPPKMRLPQRRIQTSISLRSIHEACSA